MNKKIMLAPFFLSLGFFQLNFSISRVELIQEAGVELIQEAIAPGRWLCSYFVGASSLGKKEKKVAILSIVAAVVVVDAYANSDLYLRRSSFFYLKHVFRQISLTLISFWYGHAHRKSQERIEKLENALEKKMAGLSGPQSKEPIHNG